ncbi:hypothetical protein PCL_00184 [Purpureocillium lilacinum]|uniref:Uncharacterized protein n=1 Tax=Purpureocillium lilacinum TaxID=33203 RepID=A0A2U3E6A7_PURLI|nr:hypothetical protein PCL_00184 [Purpureocillium lilacinum]
MKSGYTFVLAAAVAALCGTAFAIEGGTCDVYTQKCTAYVTEPVGRDRTGRTQYAVVPKYYSCSSSARSSLLSPVHTPPPRQTAFCRDIQQLRNTYTQTPPHFFLLVLPPSFLSRGPGLIYCLCSSACSARGTGTTATSTRAPTAPFAGKHEAMVGYRSVGR